MAPLPKSTVLEQEVLCQHHAWWNFLMNCMNNQHRTVTAQKPHWATRNFDLEAWGDKKSPIQADNVTFNFAVLKANLTKPGMKKLVTQ